MRQCLAILFIFLFLLVCGAGNPAKAAFKPSLDLPNIAGWTLASLALSVAAHYIYKNSPAERVRGYGEDLGLGEWYFGGYLGYSYLPPMDWKIAQNATSTPLGPVARNMVYRPGPQVGLKFGRYFDSLPWFGTEVETSFSRNVIHGPQGKISPPLADPGYNVPTRVLGGSDYFMVWATQVNLLARYGFLKDKEVPFGRLQPYIGIGPGFEIVYGTYDSMKNFAFEGLAGIRYMCSDKISIFFEYKYSYQFNIEYQDVHINKTGAVSPTNTKDYTFIMNFPHHRFVVGVAYHFKNLYGN